MPSFTRGKKRDVLTYVPINDLLFYGFSTKDLSNIPGVSTQDIAALGHVGSDAVPSGKIRVFKADAPKPPRVKKSLSGPVTQQGSVSTFCAPANLAAALAAGFKKSKSANLLSLRAPSANSRSHSAIAELTDGSLYVFSLNSADFTLYGEAFGLKSATTVTSETEKKKVVRGSSLPKPGVAQIEFEDRSKFSTFYGKDATFTIATATVSVLSSEEILTITAPN